MRLFLVRHGNTFESNETPYLVGAKEDLQLTGKGESQAKKVGAELLKIGVRPSLIISGTLKRTVRSAQIISEELDLGGALKQDPRLNEIDYGNWGGLTSDQITKQFPEDWIGWDKHSVWPKSAGFQPSERVIIDQVSQVVAELIAVRLDSAVVISSNGKLRYFLKLITGEFEARAAQGTFKMATGAISELCFDGKKWNLERWNAT